MPSTNLPTDSGNWLVAVGSIDPSAAQTSLQLESGRIVSIPTALLLGNTVAAGRESETYSSAPDSTTVIPIIAEEMVISKRMVPLETVRLVKSSEQRTERLEVPVMQEHWEATRVPVDTEVAAHSDVRYDGETAIYPVFEERVITRKALFLVEELHVRKIVETTKQVVEASLMHEVLTVEPVAP